MIKGLTMEHRQIVIEKCPHLHTVEVMEHCRYINKCIICTDCGKDVTGMQKMTMTEIKEHHRKGTQVTQL